MNAIVIVSLLYPAAFGNLAILRLLRTTKIIKIYLYNKKIKKDIKRNPDMEMQTVKLAKAVGKEDKSVEKNDEAARERIFSKR